MPTQRRPTTPRAATNWEELSALCLPAGLLAFWNIVLVALVSWYQPLLPWLPWLAATTVLAIGAALWRFTPRARYALLFALVCALPTAWAVLAERTGEMWPVPAVSIHMDAWSYGALAEYLRDYRKDAAGGLAVTDQWSSHLQHTRFSTSSLLAFARLAGDPLDAQTIFLSFWPGCQRLCFGRVCASRGTEPRCSLATASFGVISGWYGTAAITAGNYDNFNFVALTCAALAVLLAWSRGFIGTSFFWMAFAVLGAGMVLAYPEGTVLVSLLVSPFAFYLVAQAWAQRQRAAILLGVMATVIILTAPYLPTALGLLANQHASADQSAGPRPGDYHFDGLLTSRFVGAFFVTGEEFSTAPFSWPGTIFGLTMIILAADGIRRLRSTIPWYPWIAFSLGGLLFWQGVLGHYAYGVYKLIFCASWWIYPAIATSVEGLVRDRSRVWFFAGLGMSTAASAALQYSTRSFRVSQPSGQVAWLKELGHLRPWLEGKSVVIALEDDFAHVWSTLMLRGVPLALIPPRAYLDMPHVRRLVAEAAPLPANRTVIEINTPGRPGEILHSAHFGLYPGTGPERDKQIDGRPACGYASDSSVWVEDRVPEAGTIVSEGGDTWNWISSNPTPYSGALAHESGLAAGNHQHFFYGATLPWPWRSATSCSLTSIWTR